MDIEKLFWKAFTRNHSIYEDCFPTFSKALQKAWNRILLKIKKRTPKIATYNPIVFTIHNQTIKKETEQES
jgi:7-cyano-7-deazaguanine synthase in queuosine biosynthesis